ncbi:hypothetical protein [Desulfolucanica intricata]|uniref:hypothetical protein n=1 Tax=Desulfolucanica intricata TaxID=1285191 RepID=UPI000834637B|nr:hypothetical protein [Desulfolucanica intricata]
METIILILDKYNLPWLLLAIITWLILFFSCSYKCFLQGLPVGIFTMITGASLEQFFISHKFWKEKFILVKIGELDLFLVTGPLLVIGILLIRFLPKSRLGMFLAILAWSSLATGIEFIALKLGFLAYHSEKWSSLHSLTGYFLYLLSALGLYYILSNKKQVDL